MSLTHNLPEQIKAREMYKLVQTWDTLFFHWLPDPELHYLHCVSWNHSTVQPLLLIYLCFCAEHYFIISFLLWHPQRWGHKTSNVWLPTETSVLTIGPGPKAAADHQATSTTFDCCHVFMFLLQKALFKWSWAMSSKMSHRSMEYPKSH